MTARLLAEVAATIGASRSKSGSVHRTGQPVRRNSKEAGTFEHAFWIAPEKGETDRILHAARRALDAAKILRRTARAGEAALTASERLLTSLTASVVRVLEELLDLARLNQGRVYPSYDRIAERTGLGRRTVSRAIAILEAIGLIVKQRRFRMAKIDDETTQYKQTSNAYRPCLPQIVRRFLPRFMRPAPLPADAAVRQADDKRNTEAMLSQASCVDRTAFVLGTESPMAAAFRRLAALVDDRECQNGAQPLPQIL